MKKVLLISTFLTLGCHAIAQNIVEGTEGRVKFSDALEQYKKQQSPFLKHEDEDHPKAKTTARKNSPHEAEEKDYHLNRWKWYWQQHLDPDGYIVSPVQTWNEWEKFESAKKANSNARTTSTAMAAWSFIGPDSSGADGSGVGRITLVAFHPTDPNTYWIGSPGGGAWKTTNNGLNWTCMTDQLPLLSLSDIKFNPQNPNTIYLCTGDKDGDEYYSIGVLKSYDGGTSWVTTGLTWSESSINLANSLLVNPTDTNTLILGTTLGIYISHNGGTSWTLTPSSSGHNFKQVLYHPTDTNIIYATTHETSSAQAQIYRSADGGTTWTQVSSMSDAYRITLAVTPADPAIVKAIVSASDPTNQYGLDGIYNSTDTGYTFTEIYTGGCSGSSNLLSFNADGTACGGQGFYDLTIAISLTNANDVYVGGINSWLSSDGGNSWTLMNQWSFDVPGTITIHADKHFMGFQPLVPGRFFECNDGGVYWSDNPTGTGIWNDITNGLGISQFYRVAISNLATYQMAGAQDDGTKLIQFGSFYDFYGGDGMECQLDPLDSNTAYASSEYGNIAISSPAFSGVISTNIPGTPTGGWVTPYVLEPSCNTCILAGYQQVYWSTDQGNSWNSISPALVSGDLLRVVTSLSDPNTVYAADDGSGNIFYTHDFGTTWNTLTAPYTGAIISDIKVDQFDATKIWVTFSGYSSPQVVSYSPSTGWTSFNSGLPNVPVNCILIDTSNRIKYLGTDIGVFYCDTTMASWQPYQASMPVIRVNDLQIDYTTNEIWAATYGRSLWSSPRQQFGPLSVANATPLKSNHLNIAPNPNNGNFTITLGSNITDKNVSVHLVNNDGEIVWQENVSVNNGNTLQVNNTSLVKGNYVLEVSNSSTVIGSKKIAIY